MEEIQRELQLQKLYIAFRSDPINDRFDDSKFCSENGISINTLEEKITTMDVLRDIAKKPMSTGQVRSSIEQLVRLAHSKSIDGKLEPKSLEGLLNATCNLLKQLNLSQGLPTERIEFKELKKLPPEKLHSRLMGMLKPSLN